MGQLTQMLPFLLMFVVIYFFMIRPQQNRMKKEKEFESALKVGDRIITKSGIHGKIVELAETTVIIETMSGKLKMERTAISMELSAALNKKAITKNPDLFGIFLFPVPIVQTASFQDERFYFFHPTHLRFFLFRCGDVFQKFILLRKRKPFKCLS